MKDVMTWLRANRNYALPAVLGLINAVLIGIWLMVITPELDALDFEMRKVRANNINLRNLVDKNAQALEAIDENREIFNTLRDDGFVEEQDRLGVTKLMDRLRKIHGLTSIYYEVSPEKATDDQATKATGFHIVSTRISIKMLGLFDADILEFSQAVIDEFPGQVRPLTFSLRKLTSPTETSLSLLRAGRLVDFIAGELTFEWNTLRPVQRNTSG